MRCAQAECMGIKRDVHRNCTRRAHGQQYKERFSNFSRHVLYLKELNWEHPDLDPRMSTFSLDIYFILVFEASIFQYIRSRDP